ncbi:ComEC/Rec2 family competence protein [Sphingobacterium chuzhouense]|uniref:Metal-dependent hydrolase, beta-lactamase superfamily II n=1 Tax=Sphingobacterium chuzhouense TaxID=1742264 RepID=A0ABR7XVV9_9SPHI|nr:hypothetical protein [Sphingobacterium chuzhouense]MBD1423192.1 hypothetical protein [Sphingobacterium chuzhouense]
MLKKNKEWIGLLLIIVLMSCSKSSSGDPNEGDNGGKDDPQNELIGKTLPDWQEGYLDIHAINTGRGESQLLIFPDGTTMLIDAAGSLISPTDAIPPPSQKPNGNVSPGLAVTNYTRHFIKTASNKINYLMLSHFDPDHMGTYSSSLPLDPTGTFRMGGITEVGAKIDFDKIIDRGYPDYNFPTNMASNSRIANYIKFIDWAKAHKGVIAEQFDVGKNDQIVLQENPSAYSNFEIRNIISNGVVWTGTGTGSTNTLPSGPEVAAADGSENIFSIGFVLSYGKFNFFTAGDLQYNGRTAHPWKDVEAPVAVVVPEVDVMKANHHATSNCNGTTILNSLKPQTVIIHPWRDVHPNTETLSRIFTANSGVQIFSTNMTEANKPRLGANLNRLKAVEGHIVVRVDPGGEEYYVYVLDDTNQDYKVTGVFGPYKSK